MKNTIKTLLILAGIAQGSAAIAETHTITISSGGQNDYSIVAGTAECKAQELKKGTRNSIECQIDMEKNIGAVPLFTIRKGGESCAVAVGKIMNNPPAKPSIEVTGSGACFNTGFAGPNVNLQ